uniref:Uncharacterized protein n=1 Tax=Anguilla anguilla TaxID=7936 RepID=A0A0E9T2J4_ANGAN
MDLRVFVCKLNVPFLLISDFTQFSLLELTMHS